MSEQFPGVVAVAIPPEALAELARKVSGSVLLPGDDGYAEVCELYNLHLAVAPAVVVEAAGAVDVQEAVRFAATHDLHVAAKASGHQLFLPEPGGVVITTRRMTGISVNVSRRTVRVEAGLRWSQVTEKVAEYGLAPMSGSAPDVGVVGYTLGGGHSPTLGRSQGFAADHVHSLDVVTADGELRHVTVESEPDLFWAMRGCKGNFGMVTGLEFDLFPVDRLFGGGLYFPGERLKDVLHAWRTWVVTLPEEATSSIAVQRLPPIPELPDPLRGAFVVHLRFSHLGSEEEGARLLAPMREVAPVVFDTMADIPYTAAGTIHSDPVDPVPYWDRTTSLNDFPAEAVDAFVAATGPDSGSALTNVEIRHAEGALSREPAVANSVPLRDVRFYVFGFGVGAPEQEDTMRRDLAAFVDALKPWSSPHLVPNFLSPEEADTPDGMRRVFGHERYERLVKIKNTYDPSNMFFTNHNVRAL
jgi:FAD/FMN-containing dehydrogenase